jgi:peptide chain release factor 1
MKVLASRLLDMELAKQHAEISKTRKSMVGSGDRSERIRTYNYPQNRLTDHRINLTLHKLDLVMEGDLEEVITELRTHHQAELLQSESKAS